MNPLVWSNDALLRRLSYINELRLNTIAVCGGKTVIGPGLVCEIIVRLLDAVDNRARVVVGIGGCPASGKTTAAAAVVGDLNGRSHDAVAAHLAMDGFHLANARLAAEGLDGAKGDLATYDVARYIEKVQQFRRGFGSWVLAPDYCRNEHEVRENVVRIGPGVRSLVTEGIYVGYSAGPWAALKELLDVLFHLDATPQECADRIVSRNLAVGRSIAAIEGKLWNDLGFMEKSIPIMLDADYIMRSGA